MTEVDLELEDLKRKIHRDRGFNASSYKDKCLRRRIAVRMRARGLERFSEYADLLDRDPDEYEVLIDTLTINVTKFFRNPEVWEVVAREVVPNLFLSPERPVSMWSAGCASGEEPYSIAILLHEWAERAGEPGLLRRFRILGTDIDRRSLEAARRGIFPELSLSETPPELREKWFSDGPPYRLDEAVRQSVAFECRDLISGEPESQQSLIICRNVIIYLDRQLQEELFQRFYDALVPGGYLILGKVETLLGPTRSLFRGVSNRERVFRKPL